MCYSVFLRFAFFKVLPGDYEILATHPTWALKEVSFVPRLWVCYLEAIVGMSLGYEINHSFLQIPWKNQGAEDVGVMRENSPATVAASAVGFFFKWQLWCPLPSTVTVLS